MFDIENDHLLSKHTFIKRSGVCRHTLNKRLEEDPDSPKAHPTPVGDMFLGSEVNAWLSKLDPKMRASSNKDDIAAQAAAVLSK